ncbi:FAD-binding monooxygenase [Grosmannia clavigera kw1407]|uniref:FAD-binding monooxygenase n=1 Tax=Grosmannia clavigera (strain kw1407 / UAMH 11150) TaxID=655863 RepID=F0XUJ4_GROCL|nr:FAD-binding monooxygenase [Grosmannia clavigera kw1407]EFW98682.1 FAD-binding monooxygenase [Grosmannia clavigera kw1407]
MAVESKAEQRFRVAIVGGGLGGLALAQMLRSNERVQVTVYERQVEVTDRLAGYRIQMERGAIAMLTSRVSAGVGKNLERSIGEQPASGHAYSNILKLVEEPRPWSDGAVTLLGDATLNMSPYTGKGASLAVANALELAKCLDQDDFLDCLERRRTLLNGYVKTMIKRRRKQRKAGVFVPRLVFSGKNSVKVDLRDSLFRIVNVAGHSMVGVRRVVGSNRSPHVVLKIEPV